MGRGKNLLSKIAAPISSRRLFKAFDDVGMINPIHSIQINNFVRIGLMVRIKVLLLMW